MAIPAPAGQTAILKVVAVALRLQTVIVEQTVDVDPGTVYNVVNVAAPGSCCPNTLIAVAIYAPIRRKGTAKSPPPDAGVVQLVVDIPATGAVALKTCPAVGSTTGKT